MTDVYLWKMRHTTLPVEFAYRIVERPPRRVPNDDHYLYAAVTCNGNVLRNPDGKLLYLFDTHLDRLLSMGEQWKAELRRDGFEDVEEDA